MMSSSLMISNHPAKENPKNCIPYNNTARNGTTTTSTRDAPPSMSHSQSYSNYDHVIKTKEKDKGSPRRCQSFGRDERQSQDQVRVVSLSQNNDNDNDGHSSATNNNNNNNRNMNRRAISMSPDVMMHRRQVRVTMPHHHHHHQQQQHRQRQFRLLPYNTSNNNNDNNNNNTTQDKMWRWLQRPKHVALLAIGLTLMISARFLIQTYHSTVLADNNSDNIPQENHHHHHHHDIINDNNNDNNNNREIITASHENKKLASNNDEILETLSKHDHSTTNENYNDNNNINAINRQDAPFAYAFLLAGIPPGTAPVKGSLLSNDKAMRDAPSRDAYRGLLYNILVSIQILKDAGSRADFIVFIQIASPFHEELDARDAKLLQAVGARILYIPPTTSYVNEFSTVVLEKFRLLELTQYARVTYLDADVMPYCNLDYIMDLSLVGTLQDNVLVSIDNTPASGSLFVLAPGPGRFQQLLQPLVKWPFKSFSFSPGRGWGTKMGEDDPWQSLSGDSGHEWDFEGADSDQGLLFHYTKYMHGNVTLINGDNLTHYQNGKRLTTADNDNSDNPLRQHSCLPVEQEKTIGNQYYSKDSLRQRTTSTTVAPYRDFAQWRYNQVKPWHYPKTPVEVSDTNQITSSRKFWFYVLRRLAVSHTPLQDELHLKPAPLRDESDLHKGEKYNDYDQANWHYVPNRKWKDLNPVWATKVQSLQQWALRIVNATAISFPWEPPVIKQDPMKHDMDEHNNNNNVLVKMREKCSCPSATISTDPCSMATSSQPLSAWLDRRVPYYISKQRPLCPDALKHPMHVLVPFYGETSQTQQGMESTLCSVACQDYPPSKVHVLLYAADADSSALEEFSQSHDIPFLAHSPPSTVEDETSATSLVKSALQQQQSSQNVVAIQSKEALPRSGINYWALKFVKFMAKPNDLVVLLHGGDTMYGEQALQQMNQAYLKWPIWTAFGSYYQSNQPDLITPASIDYRYKQGQRAFRPRQDEPSWNLHFSGKPFSFKAHMLGDISVRDFMDDGKTFLGNEIGSAVDQAFICRMLEASGAARIGTITEPLYYSNSATEDNRQLLSHLQTSQSTPLKELPIHLVMLWRGENERFFLLSEQLTWLQEQSAARKLQLHLHLLTTKSDESKPKEVNGVLADFAAKQQQGSQGFIPIKLTVSHLKSIEGQKYGQWARFHYVQELQEKEAMERVVFMSDNQYWMPDFVESLLQTQKPGTLAAWHGKRFSKDVTTARAGYERSEVQWKHIVRRNKNELDTFTHGSLDGASLDTNLWLLGLVTNPEEIFGATQADNIMTTSVSTNEMDELWASYIVDALLGWEIRRVDKSVPIELDQVESKLVQNKLFSLLPPGAGSKLVELHSQLPSRGDDDKGLLWAFDEHKHNLLQSLQSKLHWNALRPSSLPSQSLERPNFVPPLTASSSSSQQRMLRRKGKKKAKKRAFVCVTGQFDRLELQNKIEYIFKPLQRDGYTTHAALVLTGEKALFTNKDGKPEFVPHYTEFSQAVEDLKANGIRLVSQNGTYSRITDPPVDDEYTRQLHRTQRWQRTRAEQEERAKNHGRIFESYLRCLHSAEEAASARNQDISTYYDVFLRIRDDAGLNRPLSGMGPRPWPGAPTGGVMHDGVPPPPNSVIVTECRNWHGMNDRFAIVSSDIAREYFTKPYSILAQHKFVDPNIVRNPETLLLNAYTTSKIHVLGHAEMKRVNRVVKQPNGESKFYQDDKWSAGCPSPYKYMHRQFELYGWYL